MPALDSLDLRAFHDLVGAAVTALDAALARGRTPRQAGVELDATLGAGSCAESLCGAVGSPERARLIGEVVEELRARRPHVPSNATAPAERVAILLLHRVDVAWWGEQAPYADTAAIRGDAALLDLHRLRRAGALRFDFATQPSSVPARAAARVRRRVRPDARPAGAGLRFAAARPEMVRLLGDVAEAFAAHAPRGTPPLWVTSLVRSVEHQRRLSALGYPARLPSSHCLGWAADVEVAWFERFGAAGALREVLLDLRDRGVANVIPEGQAWHLCPSPAHAARLR